MRRNQPWQTKCFRQTEQNGNFGRLCSQSSTAFKVMNKLPGYDIKETSRDKINKHRTSSLFQCKVVKAFPSPLCIARGPISSSVKKSAGAFLDEGLEFSVQG